ncbi:hypothetical protein [Spirosoma sp.]|uniref:hypothetical protein n=1 Tax=Spirosoma sp. TaxID=1899569 RepID=UPI002631FB32|nr:hypothetical protein [Spirosoma sp.]MCX6216591.1 hypothetical protein [Spirosoma sp.]
MSSSSFKGFTVSLEFETSPTYGVLYRRLRAAKDEREAELNRRHPLDVVLFREVRDLENMMSLLRSAYEKTVAQWTTREEKVRETGAESVSAA